MVAAVQKQKSPRAPRIPREIAPRPEPPLPPDAPRLRLTASRGTLGLELDAPFDLAPVRVQALSLTFPRIRFPIDLTGGVARFRHRRGDLARLVLHFPADRLEAWVAPRLRGLLGGGSGAPRVTLVPFEGGIAVGLASEQAALAFDLLVAPEPNGVRLFAERARGMGLTTAPHALALRAVVAALGSGARVDAGAIVVPQVASAVLRAMLPPAGARVPDATPVVWQPAIADGGALVLAADADQVPGPPLPRLASAIETAGVAAHADLASFEGDWDAARARYLVALEAAPRHPELSERLAWLDVTNGERAEAALATLVDAMPAIDAGALGAELLHATGDPEAAIVALRQHAATEPFSALAARLWHKIAAWSERLSDRRAALAEAIARAPAWPTARWDRLETHLRLGDASAALGDAEHLEAAARGAAGRHAALARAAQMFLEQGFFAEARRLFERALRYAPDDANAVAGLAEAAGAMGDAERSLALFGRAVALAERHGAPADVIHLAYAKILVAAAGDRPAAIARVRRIAPHARVPSETEAAPDPRPHAAIVAEARICEARWRAEIGDLAGAGLAIGRLRDLVEREVDPPAGHGEEGRGAVPAPHRARERRSLLASFLREAAHIDEELREDPVAAERDLAAALRFAPNDRDIAARLRRLGRRKHAAPTPSREERGGRVAPPAPPTPPPPTPQRDPPRPPPHNPTPRVAFQAPPPVTPALPAPGARKPRAAPDPHDDATVADAHDTAAHDTVAHDTAAHDTVAPLSAGAAEREVERLTAVLRADPTDRDTATAIARLLEQLDRDLDLFALISARLDETGDHDERADLLEQRRTVLGRLATRARAEGRDLEASLYEDILATPDP